MLAFLACETQWRFAVGMGGATRLGLDYPSVDVALRRLDLDHTFADLQIMERAALTAFGEQA